MGDWHIAAGPLIRKLENRFTLTCDEKQAIHHLPARLGEVKGDQDIVREGDRPLRCCFVLEGVTCTYKIAGEGKRQITNFHIAGDGPDLQSLHLENLDVSISTLTPCKLGFVPHEDIRDLCARFPRIAGALWRETLIDASIFREWMVNVGQRPARVRIAHLMCEMVVRFQAIGQAEGLTIK